MNAISDFFNIVYSVSFIIQLFVMSFSFTLIFTNVEKKARSIIYFILRIAACFTIYTAYTFSFFMLAYYCKPLFYYNYFIAYFLSLVTCCLIFSKLDKRSNVILIATLFGMEVTVSQLEHSLMFFYDTNMASDLKAFISICLFSLIGAFAIIVKSNSISKISNITGNSIFLVVSVNSVFVTLVCIYIGITSYVFAASTSSDIYFISTLSAFYVLEILVYFLIYLDLKQNQDNSNLRIEKKMLEADLQAMTLTKQSVKEIHDIKHDIKNQYLVMQTMLEQNKEKELEIYLRKAGADIANIPLAADYGNKDLNTIINIETLKAHSMNVTLSVIAKVPSILPFELNDLCSLICNLIDNAIEATKASGQLDIPITCIFNIKQDYFCTVIKNPVLKSLTRDDILSFKSSKKDSTSHGLGHSIVEKTAVKYNGYVEYEFDNGFFIAEAFLDMKHGGENHG